MTKIKTKSTDSIYKPVFDVKKIDYQRIVTDYGVEFEIIGSFMSDSHTVNNIPDRAKLIDKLTEVLKGTGVSKITITFLSDNL